MDEKISVVYRKGQPPVILGEVVGFTGLGSVVVAVFRSLNGHLDSEPISNVMVHHMTLGEYTEIAPAEILPR